MCFGWEYRQVLVSHLSKYRTKHYRVFFPFRTGNGRCSSSDFWDRCPLALIKLSFQTRLKHRYGFQLASGMEECIALIFIRILSLINLTIPAGCNERPPCGVWMRARVVGLQKTSWRFLFRSNAFHLRMTGLRSCLRYVDKIMSFPKEMRPCPLLASFPATEGLTLSIISGLVI